MISSQTQSWQRPTKWGLSQMSLIPSHSTGQRSWAAQGTAQLLTYSIEGIDLPLFTCESGDWISVFSDARLTGVRARTSHWKPLRRNRNIRDVAQLGRSPRRSPMIHSLTFSLHLKVRKSSTIWHFFPDMLTFIVVNQRIVFADNDMV